MQNPHVFTLRALIFLELASSVYPHRVVGRRVWGRVPQHYVSVIPTRTQYTALYSGYNETARPIKFTVVRIQNLAEYRTNFVFSTMRKNTL